MKLNQLLVILLIALASQGFSQGNCDKIVLHGVQGSAFGVYSSAVEYKVIQMEGVYSNTLDLYLSYYPIIAEGELYVNFNLEGAQPFNLLSTLRIFGSTGIVHELKLSQFIIDGKNTNEYIANGKRISLRAKVNPEDLAVLAGDRIEKIEFAGITVELLQLRGDDFRKIAQCVSLLADKTNKEFNSYLAYEHLKRPKSERMFRQTENGYVSANDKSVQKARKHGIGIEY